MAKLQFRKTRIYVWLFSLLVLIVPFIITAGIVLRLGSDDFQGRIISSVSGQLPAHIEEGIDRQPVKRLLQNIQVPLLSILFFILAGGAFALTYFYRYLIRPLDQMALTARQIIEGNLDLSMPKNSCYEVNEVGRSFNDLSSNLQEVILLVWNYLRDTSGILDTMIESEPLQLQKDISPPMRQGLTAIREKLGSIEQVVTAFDLYDVRIEDQRAMAGANTWQGGTEQLAQSTTQADGHD